MARVKHRAIQGKTFTAYRTLVSNGAAVNLTGFTGTGTLRDEVGGSSLATFTVTVTSGSTGQYEYSLTSATTAGLSVGKYVFDIELSVSGETDPVYDGDHGSFEVLAEITT